MGENLKIQSLIKELDELILTCTKNKDLAQLSVQFYKLYYGFMMAVHHDLVLEDDQGSAVATASCIPIWEMLHFHSGLLGPLRGSIRAFVICFLTTLYPKSGDRRCLYQHKGCIGNSTFPRVPLTIRLPMDGEVIKYLKDKENENDSYFKVVEYVKNTVTAEEYILRDPSANVLKSMIKILIEDVLPRCHLVKKETDTLSIGVKGENLILIPLTGESTFSIRSFNILEQTIWKYLIFSHVHIYEDGKKLSDFLINSTWSRRILRLDNHSELTYGNIISSIVHGAAVCTSIMPRVVSEAVDNTPLVHPHFLEDLLQKEIDYQELSTSKRDFTEPFTLDCIKKKRVSLAYKTAKNLREIIEVSIPQEIEFFNKSSSARDCDKLTQLCRNIILSPVTQDDTSIGISSHFMKRILFDRKRKRDDGIYEGPTFLPIESSLSDVLDEKTANKSLSTLERIATTSNVI